MSYFAPRLSLTSYFLHFLSYLFPISYFLSLASIFFFCFSFSNSYFLFLISNFLCSVSFLIPFSLTIMSQRYSSGGPAGHPPRGRPVVILLLQQRQWLSFRKLSRNGIEAVVPRPEAGGRPAAVGEEGAVGEGVKDRPREPPSLRDSYKWEMRNDP